MEKYHKIYTVWKRDPATKYKTLIAGRWKTHAFEYLKDLPWFWYEKVDGTNVRITYTNGEIIFNGRNDLTDADGNYRPPEFSKNLWADLRRVFTADWFDAFFDPADEITLYGEGFGAGIQKGGAYGEATFCLFDIMINGLWLQQIDVSEIADRSGVQRAPLVNLGTLEDAVVFVRRAGNQWKSHWGDFQPEGLILRPPVDLFDRRGNRVIGKIKCRDFPNN